MSDELTILDEFAKAAMQGLIAAGYFEALKNLGLRDGRMDATSLSRAAERVVAAVSYNTAEEMMAERDRRLGVGAEASS